MTSSAVSFNGRGARDLSLSMSAPPEADAALRASLLQDAAATPEPAQGCTIASEYRSRFDAVVALYDQGEWREAFAQVARLADAGHAPAAKLALLMSRYGAALYAAPLRADPLQIARWASLVIDAVKWKAAAATCRADRHLCLVGQTERPTARAQAQRPGSFPTVRPTASPSSITAMA